MFGATKKRRVRVDVLTERAYRSEGGDGEHHIKYEVERESSVARGVFHRVGDTFESLDMATEFAKLVATFPRDVEVP